MYSSAEWERAEFPGPIFTEGKRIKAWSTKRRRAERLFSHQDRPSHKRMIQIRAGGAKAEAAGLDLAMNLSLISSNNCSFV